MKLCRVTGDLVSSVKSEKLQGHKLLCVQPVQLDGKTPDGASFIAVDRAQAGVSDLVLTIEEGGGCRILLADDKTVINALIVAVVDDLEVLDWDGLVGVSTYEAKLGDDS